MVRPVSARHPGAPRKPSALRKVPFNTRLPQWLCAWLTAPERQRRGPVLIEEALCAIHNLQPPQITTDQEEMPGTLHG